MWETSPPAAPLLLKATVYTHLGPHPLSPPLPKLGEGEARQGFPPTPSPALGEGVGG